MVGIKMEEDDDESNDEEWNENFSEPVVEESGAGELWFHLDGIWFAAWPRIENVTLYVEVPSACAIESPVVDPWIYKWIHYLFFRDLCEEYLYPEIFLFFHKMPVIFLKQPQGDSLFCEMSLLKQ